MFLEIVNTLKAAALANNIGTICHNKGDFCEALNYYSKAFGLFQILLPIDHFCLEGIKRNLKNLPVYINHDFGGVDNLRILDRNGKPIRNANIYAYTKKSWEANDSNSKGIIGTTIVDENGRWFWSIPLVPGEYVLNIKTFYTKAPVRQFIMIKIPIPFFGENPATYKIIALNEINEKE